jgi:hypothetical protein
LNVARIYMQSVARVKHHITYRYEEGIERLQNYSGSMTRADSGKGPTRFFMTSMPYLTGALVFSR